MQLSVFVHMHLCMCLIMTHFNGPVSVCKWVILNHCLISIPVCCYIPHTDRENCQGPDSSVHSDHAGWCFAGRNFKMLPWNERTDNISILLNTFTSNVYVTIQASFKRVSRQMPKRGEKLWTNLGNYNPYIHLFLIYSSCSLPRSCFMYMVNIMFSSWIYFS